MAQTDVPIVEPRSSFDLDRWADGLLQDFFPDVLGDPGPLDVERLFELILPAQFDIDIGVEELPFGVEGIAEPPNRLTISVATHAGIASGIGHHRFTGAHEATHALLHLPELKQRLESTGGARLYRREKLKAFVDPEWQANRGAAGLLMPARTMWWLHGDGRLSIESIVRLCRVSREAAGYRIADFRNRKVWRPTN